MREMLLHLLARLVIRRPAAVIAAGACCAVVAAIYSVSELRVDSDTNALIGKDRPYMARYLEFVAEFGELEFAWVVVDPHGQQERATECIRSLVDRLRQLPEVGGVRGIIEPDEQLRIATRAMPDGDLQDLARAAPALDVLRQPTVTPGTVLARAMERLDRLGDPGGGRQGAEQNAATAVFLLDALASSAPGVKPRLQAPPPEPLRSESGRLYFIQVEPAADFSSLGAFERSLLAMRAELDAARSEYPGLEIGLTGKPVLQEDELATSARDMTRASILAIVAIGLLFVGAFANLRRPLMMVASLLFAIAWTFGFATLLVGHLNLLSMVFAIILVGVGIDFGVHLVSRYIEERQDGDRLTALSRAMISAGRGNITGALTSSAAFVGAMLGGFRGLQELALIAASGLLLCVVAMSAVLPAMLNLCDRRDAADGRPAGGKRWVPGRSVIDRIHRMSTRNPRAVLWTAVAATLIAGWRIPDLRFEDNLLELQAVGLDSVQWQRRIMADSADAVWFVAIRTKDMNELSAVVQRARALPTVGAVHSVLDVVRVDTPERIAMRAALHDSAGVVEDPAPEHPLRAADLREAAGQLRVLATLAGAYSPRDAAHVRDVSQRLEALAGAVDSDPTVVSTLEAGIRRQGKVVGLMVDGDRQQLRDALPAATRSMYQSPSGTYLATVHPRHDVWDYDAMGRFVADVREVDPSATGVPMTHYESIREMRSAFNLAAIMAVLAVVALVWLDFRSWSTTCLAILPVAFGFWWLIALMALFGVSFNLANFFAVPILIGIGVDNGVHILHRYRETGRHLDALGVTRRAVLLASLTTTIGFGAMASATHRGLQSLGIVMATGSLTCLLGALVVLPATVTCLAGSEARDRT